MSLSESALSSSTRYLSQLSVTQCVSGNIQHTAFCLDVLVDNPRQHSSNIVHVCYGDPMVPISQAPYHQLALLFVRPVYNTPERLKEKRHENASRNNGPRDIAFLTLLPQKVANITLRAKQGHQPLPITSDVVVDAPLPGKIPQIALALCLLDRSGSQNFLCEFYNGCWICTEPSRADNNVKICKGF